MIILRPLPVSHFAFIPDFIFPEFENAVSFARLNDKSR